MTGPVLFVGAHTGGHLYPAVAVARALQNMRVDCVFAGAGKPIERDILGREEFDLMEIGELARAGGFSRAWPAVSRLFAQVRPSAVVATGGAAALWPGVRAALARRPLFLLEPNRVLGRANRWLLRAATRIFLAFPETLGPRRLRRRSLVYGCPVRREFQPTPLPTNLRLLVLGGSQGSEDLNELSIAITERLVPELRSRLQVRHVAGPGKGDSLRDRYRACGVTAEVVEFETAVAEEIARASLIVARSGGSTVAEIAAVGRGALFLPYPHHKDRQQFLNADVAAASGAAEIVDKDPDSVTALLGRLLADRSRLESMADASVRLGRPSAARDVARVIATHIERLPVGIEAAS